MVSEARRISPRPKQYLFGPFQLSTSPLRLTQNDETIPLRRQALQLLELLIESAGHTVSREQIRTHLWGDQRHVDFERGINTTMLHLRRGLDDDPKSPRYIETVTRQGYRFLAAVDLAPMDDSAVQRSAGSGEKQVDSSIDRAEADLRDQLRSLALHLLEVTDEDEQEPAQWLLGLVRRSRATGERVVLTLGSQPLAVIVAPSDLDRLEEAGPVAPVLEVALDGELNPVSAARALVDEPV